jgi:hypothetical protein
MSETITGRLDRGDDLLHDDVEASIEGRRITFDFIDGEAWVGERHTITTADGRVIAFVIDRRRAYAADPLCDLETLEGSITSITREPSRPANVEARRAAGRPTSSASSV